MTEYFKGDSEDCTLRLVRESHIDFWSMWWKTAEPAGFFIAEYISTNIPEVKVGFHYKDDISGGWQRAREMVWKEGWYVVKGEIPLYTPAELVEFPDKPETYKDKTRYFNKTILFSRRRVLFTLGRCSVN